MSGNRIGKVFDFLTHKVCFTFAVSFFSILGATAAVPALIFIMATIPYETPSDFHRDVAVCVTLIIIGALTHYLLYGLGRLWGKKWEQRDLLMLNDHMKGSLLMEDIPTPELQEISSLMERLPGKNIRMAMLLSLPAVIIGSLQHFAFTANLTNALFFFRGGVIAWITYIIFTYIITELITGNLRRTTRLMLADRNAWEGTQNSTTLVSKFAFIIILMITSMVITHGVATSTVIESSVKAVMVFWVLNLVVGVFMCGLVFLSILITLNEIEATAIQLSEEKRARFISGSIDREFVNTAMGLYRAANKIIKYRDDLHNLNANLEKKVRERTEQIERLTRTDPLTECFNRRYLMENLPQEIKKAQRYHTSFSLVLCDLDHFKEVNDTHGHQVGDKVLKEFVDCIKGAFRSDVDWVARYGGEEFIIALPETDVNGGGILAERIRKSIEQRKILMDSREVTITVSFGMTGFDPCTPQEKITAENLIREADRCLYQAKEEGRNRVIVCPL